MKPRARAIIVSAIPLLWSVVASKAEKIMAQARSPVEQVLRQIDRMSEVEQCELLEARSDAEALARKLEEIALICVLCGNVQTSNATVYIIDTVLLPAS